MNSIEDVLKISMENLRSLADANTIIGTPVSLCDGSTVIPVTRVIMGILTGGSDIPVKTAIQESAQCMAQDPFGGTTAAGVGLTPVSFIVVQNGEAKVMPVEYNNSVDRLIDVIMPLVNAVAGKIKCNCE